MVSLTTIAFPRAAAARTVQFGTLGWYAVGDAGQRAFNGGRYLRHMAEGFLVSIVVGYTAQMLYNSLVRPAAFLANLPGTVRYFATGGAVLDAARGNPVRP